MLLGGSPTNLAARCLWHNSGLDQDDVVGRRTHKARHHGAGTRFQRFPFCRIGLRLGQDDDPLRAGNRISYAKCGHRALNQTRNVSEGLFQLLGINMFAGANDDVFDAAGDEDIAVGHVPPITAVEPAVAEQLPRLGLIAEIAGSRRRAAKLEPALSPLLDFPAGVVDNANFVAGQGASASDNFNGIEDRRCLWVRQLRGGSELRA